MRWMLIGFTHFQVEWRLPLADPAGGHGNAPAPNANGSDAKAEPQKLIEGGESNQFGS